MTLFDIERLKAAHRATWASGDYASVAGSYVSPIAEAAVARAGVRPGSDVLDVATGTGNAALPAALAGARVTGLDLVPELLDVARRRGHEAGLGIDWIEGDAEALPFPDGSFDTVLSVLGVQFAPRHEVAAQELVRVTRRGGTIVTACWTPASFIGQMFETMSPYLPAPPEGASPPPLWGDEAHVRELFADSDVELEFEAGSVDFHRESPAGFVAYMADVYGPLLEARERLAASGTWGALHDELVALCERSNIDGAAFRTPSEYSLALGHRRG